MGGRAAVGQAILNGQRRTRPRVNADQDNVVLFSFPNKKWRHLQRLSETLDEAQKFRMLRHLQRHVSTPREDYPEVPYLFHLKNLEREMR
jgi:hypothetical protein